MVRGAEERRFFQVRGHVAGVQPSRGWARSAEVIHSPVMQALVWARVPGDLVFSVGVIAFCLFMVRTLFVGERASPADTTAADFAAHPAE